MTSYGLLDQADEDSLHKSRLLNVEKKPFERISKRLLNPDSFVISNATLPTPPPEGTDGEAAAAAEAEKQKRLEQWRQFRDDVSLDFAAFEGSIARIQFLLTSNERERERYVAEKERILSTMQAVRENTSDLRVQLEEAQRLLNLRKTYDELTDKITSNRLLKPREDQQANLQKLQAEIAELERESKDYATTWAERREQFGRIVEEGMQLRRLIRDEKEEVERREGMQEEEDGDDGEVSKGKQSGSNTPRPDQEALTPSQQGQDEAGRSPLTVHADKADKATPGAATPLRQVTTAGEETKQATQQDDSAMVDEGEVTADEGSGRNDELEEGEELLDDRNADKMDTT
ncbi:Tho complex subunit 7-domain-containing protein [Aspergillus egyptiacus]|nr:Tho complex subunit 7-domain-containing protein [Aspergillus egyptiacus]